MTPSAWLSKSWVTNTIVLQIAPGDRVDRAERFIHQQYRWVRRERLRDTDTLLLPTGQLTREAVAEVGRVEADQVHHLFDPVVDPLLAPAEQAGHHRDVLRDGEMREQPGLRNGFGVHGFVDSATDTP